MNDAGTADILGRARRVYELRRRRLAEELAARRLEIDPGHGLSVFIPVVSESYALVTLAARGIAVHAGAKFSTHPTNAIRLATSILKESDVARVAESIALAADPSR